MAHAELSMEERRQIERLRLARTPVARIAARLRRHRSTIYRELRRNRFADEELPELDGYWGMVAHDMASTRRRRRRKLIRLPSLMVAIVDRLRAGWSPEQIAGRLRREGGKACVSHETIYAWVYSKDGRERGLARHLPSRRKRRRPRHARKPRGAVFPPERAIKHRPAAVAGRRVFGHWEGGWVPFRGATTDVAVGFGIRSTTPGDLLGAIAGRGGPDTSPIMGAPTFPTFAAGS